MPTINDKVFGEMTLNEEYWEKIETKKIFGKEKRIKLYADNCNGEISEVQRKAYLDYKMQEGSYCEAISEALLEFYLDTYDFISETWNVPEKYNKQNVTKWNVTELLDFTELYFSEFGDCSWIAKCPWDDLNHLCFDLSEDGVEVMVVPVINNN